MRLAHELLILGTLLPSAAGCLTVDLGEECNARTCAGCCTDEGYCVVGDEDDRCGSDGVVCRACEGAESCEEGACVYPSECTARGCEAGSALCCSGGVAGAYDAINHVCFCGGR